MSIDTMTSATFSTEALKELAASTGTTQVTANYPGWPANTLFVTLPQSGTLVVSYGWNTVPASTIYIWHQGGSTTPITQGTGSYAVGQNDFLIYTLPSGTTSIKLAWYYA